VENPLRPTVAPDLGPDFALIETMLWTPAGGIAHRARHLARLAHSARHFGITPCGVDAALAGICSDTA
jgi:4-amino-4-deoxychorismate lyase